MTLMKLFGFNRKGYYRAGHAAVVLINGTTGQCHYFDFGRYHTPFAHGRVRSANTDPELTIHTRATLQNRQILNIKAILHEIAGKKACHGSGDLYGSVTGINFDKAYKKARQLQVGSPLPYGPFVWNGTKLFPLRTCSFVGRPTEYLHWNQALASLHHYPFSSFQCNRTQTTHRYPG